MKDDYLWDKTGEPDPEIEHLERVLGGLRHRREGRHHPAFEIKPRPQARLFPKMLAIAAALAFAMLALGALAAFMRQSGQSANQGPSTTAMASPVPMQQTIAPPLAPVKEGDPDTVEQRNSSVRLRPSQSRLKEQPLVARRRSINRSRGAATGEQAEGLMAKEQLIKALQITTSKLDFVQKKVKGDPKQGPAS